MTHADYEEVLAIWKRIKALRTLKSKALFEDTPGAWLANAAELALQAEYARLDALYRETHPTLPGMDA